MCFEEEIVEKYEFICLIPHIHSTNNLIHIFWLPYTRTPTVINENLRTLWCFSTIIVLVSLNRCDDFHYYAINSAQPKMNCVSAYKCVFRCVDCPYSYLFNNVAIHWVFHLDFEWMNTKKNQPTSHHSIAITLSHTPYVSGLQEWSRGDIKVTTN